MAGIGFALQKLSRRGDILGIVAAYMHAALASSAPWLFTIMALAAVIIYAGPTQLDFDMLTIRMMIIYNFAFSLVFTSPGSRVRLAAGTTMASQYEPWVALTTRSPGNRSSTPGPTVSTTPADSVPSAAGRSMG